MKFFKKTILWFLGFLSSFKRTGPTLVVLMYHSVAENGWKFSVSPQAFRKQMKYLLDKGFTFISTDELFNFIHGKISGKFVLVTFDDGYSDFISGALPVLKEFGIPSIIFIHTDRSNKELGNNFPLMPWDDIRKISNAGVVIGNHSHSHPNLKKLDQEALHKEFEDSENTFRKELGEIPKFFAYPGGKFNQTVANEIKNRGYKASFTVDSGLVQPGDDPTRLKRVGVTREIDMSEFGLMISYAGDWYERLRHKLKK